MTCASKISWSRSPTRSYIACISRFSARPRWTSLMSASSALRWRVSSNSRAFSSATLRLPARVVRSRTSASLNACSRSRFWSEIRPVASPPTRSGTNSTDIGGSPVPTARSPPARRSLASTRSLISERFARLDARGRRDRRGRPLRLAGSARPARSSTGSGSCRSRDRARRCRRPGHRRSRWSRSPSRSYIACMSRFSARPRWTSLISASSALRCRVSSNSRAFSSATLRLPARVVSRRRSTSLNARSRSRFWSEITPVALPETTSGTHTEDLGRSPTSTSGCAVLGEQFLRDDVEQKGFPRFEDVLAEPDGCHRVGGQSLSLLDDVREADETVGLVEHRDIDHLGVEDVTESVPDEVVHRLHLEVLGQAALDVVDERELGVALASLLEQPSVLERDAQAPRERREESHVGVAERVLPIDVLERDQPDRPLAHEEWNEDQGLNGFPCDHPWMADLRRPSLDVVVDDDRLSRLERDSSGSRGSRSDPCGSESLVRSRRRSGCVRRLRRGSRY